MSSDGTPDSGQYPSFADEVCFVRIRVLDAPPPSGANQSQGLVNGVHQLLLRVRLLQEVHCAVFDGLEGRRYVY